MTDFDEIAAAVDAQAGAEPADARKALGKYSVRDQVAALATGGGGGGGGSVVGCVLARDAVFDIHDAGSYNIEWDALYDNLWDLNTLAEIPAGLGLAFAFDGTSSLIVPAESGVWTFNYFAERSVPDDSWAGSLSIGGVGQHIPWVQQMAPGDFANGKPFLAGTLATPLPAGTQLTHQVSTETAATSTPYTCTQVYLSIVRHA